MNVFNKDLGVHQGRIVLAPAPEGAFVYELGHALLRDANVAVGDFHEVKQTFTVSAGSKFLRASIVVTVPKVLPVGSGWLLSATLNNVRMVNRQLRVSKHVIKLEDWRVSLAGAAAAPATNVIAFRLELV